MSASPTITAIRNEIVTVIKTAMNASHSSAVTTVHDYRRFWRDADKFNSLFKRTDTGAGLGKINGWMVDRSTVRETQAPEWFRVYLLHRFQLDGFCGIQDSGFTEKNFHNQIELIRAGLRLNTTIFGNWEMTQPVASLDTFEPVTVGDATCWHAVISLTAESIENKFT